MIGGGLAGSEAAWQLGSRGIEVVLHEMRPVRTTPAHETDRLAELVCSNTLGNRLPHTAPGIFKQELQALSSLIVASGHAAYVPAGGALAVDRDQFAAAVSTALEELPTVQIRREEVTELPPGRVIVATGPLTSPALSEAIAGLTGGDDLYFYDAIAPIVNVESVDETVSFWANRYEGDDGDGDYLNLPMNKEEYEAFLDALIAGECTPSKDFEKEIFFGGCQPVEAIAATGRESLRFGPMKPVGLFDPRTRRRPWAVVQLRRETRTGAAMNMVGFQTKLKYGEQTRIFRMIPGLQEAEFLRLGSVHRNTFLNAPAILDRALRVKADPRISFAGQIVGCEGYTESSAMGLWAALNIVAERQSRELAPPPTDTMFGALLDYLATSTAKKFQPMNVNFGLLPPDSMRVKKKQKKERRIERGKACVASFEAWASASGMASEALSVTA
ncbi:MAG: methylenetetrahydrofolate--tRNA-(uracil(54)-C(5))-methyltransferase (FADH(2)-oxidizing) TrmFO [Proteobacteria bacterium]|nr:methylenetetrahydrofolate--tRNA-(uracil(54)-C(5))-methyltransferase (FADH(2)-oxidizing) TrmFO [Pseudomonadota bacterium]